MGCASADPSLGVFGLVSQFADGQREMEQSGPRSEMITFVPIGAYLVPFGLSELDRFGGMSEAQLGC
ncbi:MAG TPA: hypothetical protein VME20_03835 [Acidimicrobiales bacterium]|nr:hypothetical protein [Acidimicrobiales bacterium]